MGKQFLYYQPVQFRSRSLTSLEQRTALPTQKNLNSCSAPTWVPSSLDNAKLCLRCASWPGTDPKWPAVTVGSHLQNPSLLSHSAFQRGKEHLLLQKLNRQEAVQCCKRQQKQSNKSGGCCLWWHKPWSQHSERLRKEDLKFKPALGNLSIQLRPCLKTKDF